MSSASKALLLVPKRLVSLLRGSQPVYTLATGGDGWQEQHWREASGGAEEIMHSFVQTGQQVAGVWQCMLQIAAGCGCAAVHEQQQQHHQAKVHKPQQQHQAKVHAQS
ncbi:hypothetical protein QJQ45_023495 [Haematococcus lacustris]|nr:hypothetical protein QJQ45_023495 [Haematococcus lacustris]